MCLNGIEAQCGVGAASWVAMYAEMDTQMTGCSDRCKLFRILYPVMFQFVLKILKIPISIML